MTHWAASVNDLEMSLSQIECFYCNTQCVCFLHPPPTCVSPDCSRPTPVVSPLRWKLPLLPLVPCRIIFRCFQLETPGTCMPGGFYQSLCLLSNPLLRRFCPPIPRSWHFTRAHRCPPMFRYRTLPMDPGNRPITHTLWALLCSWFCSRWESRSLEPTPLACSRELLIFSSRLVESKGISLFPKGQSTPLTHCAPANSINLMIFNCEERRAPWIHREASSSASCISHSPPADLTRLVKNNT